MTFPATSKCSCSSNPPANGCSCCCGCRCRRCRTSIFRGAAPACSTSRAPIPRCAPPPSCGSPTTSKSTRATPASACPKLVEARVSLPSDRSFTSFDEALAHVTGPRLPPYDGVLLEPGPARRAARVPDPSPTAPSFRSIRRSRAWAAASSPRCASCRRAARCAPSNSTAIPAWCGSIRAGTRRRRASSTQAFCTSSTAPTTCCSSSAW